MTEDKYEVALDERVTKLADHKWAIKLPVWMGVDAVERWAKDHDGQEPSGEWRVVSVKRNKQTYKVKRLYRLYRVTLDFSACDDDRKERLCVGQLTANQLKEDIWLAQADSDAEVHAGTLDVNEFMDGREQRDRKKTQSVTREEKGFINALKALGLDPATMKAEDIAALLKPKAE